MTSLVDTHISAITFKRKEENMANNSDWLDGGEIVKLRANYDKSTKTTWRYIVDDNDYGISGALYVKKVPDVKDKDAPSSLIIKVKAKG